MSVKEFLRISRQETEQTIPQRFSHQVARHRDASAVITASGSISYRELDELSNQVANAVAQHSQGGSNTVVTVFDQGAESIIAILGALKAGKTFVSLNPAATAEELRRIVTDCDPELILASRIHKRGWEGAGLASAEILSLEETAGFSDRQPGKLQRSPDDPAYIFYTSGSTGPPKGVVDSHRNVLHNVLRYTNSLEIDCKDRLSLVQACNFSGTVSSLFSALLNGATICPFDLAGNGIEALADFIIHQQVSIFHSVPTIFENLTLTGRSFPDLRIVRLEGDRTEPRHIDLFNRLFDDRCKLAIGLGATETGLTRQYLLTHKQEYPDTDSLLGYAVEDMDITLVDESGEEVDPGEVGEIQVSSSYLALGYWRRPELTQERFRPCRHDSRIRKYRSGDMARMLDDTCLVYRGRKDSRDKVRGITIDAIDVELNLQSHPYIQSALVQVLESRPGIQQLAAYLVPEAGTSLTVSEIRQYLSGRLSAYMVPARYEFLEALPTDQNGKIGRLNLPPLHTSRPPLQQTYQPATTALQKVLVQCFEEVLALTPVGVQDSFYDLGGDSLLLMRLLITAEEKTGLTFPEAPFFESPDILSIEKHLAEKPQTATIVDLQPLGNRSPLFCLHTELGIEVEYRNLARRLGPDIPVVGLQAADIPVHVEAISIESLATEYLSLIKKRQASGPYFLCGTCFSGLLAFEIGQQLEKRGEAVAFLGLIDTEYPRETLVAALRRIQLSSNPLIAIGGMIHSKARDFLGLSTRQKAKDQDDADNDRQECAGPLPGSMQNTPHELTSTRTGKLLNDAGLKYRPKAYPGALTLFYTGTIGNRYGWHRLARRRYTAIRIPARPGETMPHLTSPPFVADLAREMREQLGENG